jgi:hypothetical protein
LVYEGPDLERLLGEIVSVHGSAVRLGEPTKVRKGGVGGFFAAVHYRVEVHLDDVQHFIGSPARSTAAVTAAVEQDVAAQPFAAEFLAAQQLAQARQLAQAQQEAEAQQLAREAFNEPSRYLAEEPLVAPAPAPAPVREPRPLAPLGTEAATTIDALEALAAGTADVFELSHAPANRPRTFDDALAAAAASLGDDPRASRFVVDEQNQLVLRSDVVTAAEGTNWTPVTPPAAVDPSPFLSSPMPSPAGAFYSGSAPQAVEPVDTERVMSGVVHELSAVGFPVGISSAALGRHDGGLTMERAFSMLPVARPLPLTPGSLVAVVGPANRAFEVARSIAAAIGVGEHEVAFVSGESARRQLPRAKFAPELVAYDVRAVEDLSPGWRRGRVAVVAVSCPGHSGDQRAVRDLISALRPSATIAIADARSKSEDVTFLCEGLGGVDALVLDRVAETLTPATLAATGIPVARLGDAPATPEEWARVASAALRRRRGEVGER